MNTPEKMNTARQEATPIQTNRQIDRNKTGTKPAKAAADQQAVKPKPTEEPKFSTGNNPSVTSSNWSWSGSTKHTEDELSQDGTEQDEKHPQPRQSQTIIETSFLKKEEEQQKQRLEEQLRKSAPDDFTDEDVKSLVTEIEELKALVDAVSAENGTKDASKHALESDGGNDHAAHDDSAPKMPQSTASVPLEQPLADSSIKTLEDASEQFHDAPSAPSIDDDALEMKSTFHKTNLSVSPGEHKSTAEDEPSWVPQSEATLPAANTTRRSPSNK